jgi:hypothetical protein
MAALAGVLGMAASASAETWAVVPSVSVSAIYDDNLFFNEARLAAVGLRVVPALSLEYRPSARFELLGRAGLVSEYYGEAEFNRWAAGRNADLTARYRLGEYTTVSLAGDYTVSAYAADVLPPVGVDYGRRTAESFGGKLELQHRLSPQITLRAGYDMQAFRLEGGHGPVSLLSSDADFVFRLTPHTTLSLKVGPRYLAGSFGAYVGGTVERKLARARLSVGYERANTLAFLRTLVVESYTARVSYLLSPALTVSATPALYRHWEHSAAEQRWWHIDAAGAYRARQWLTVFLSYAYVMQDRGLFIDPFTSRRGPPQLSRNALAAGFILTPRHARREPEDSRQ